MAKTASHTGRVRGSGDVLAEHVREFVHAVAVTTTPCLDGFARLTQGFHARCAFDVGGWIPTEAALAVAGKSATPFAGHVHNAAQAAQMVLGEVITVSEQRWYDSRLLEEIVNLADAKATEIGGQYFESLIAERDTFVKGAD